MTSLNPELEQLFSEIRFQNYPAIIEHLEERLEKVTALLQSESPPEHIKNLDKHKALLRVASYSSLSNFMDIGFYNGVKENDPIAYNNGLYTYVRLNTERVTLLASGTDHCKFFPYVIDHLTCGEFDRSKELLSLDLGISKQGHRLAVTATNLLQALLWDKNDLIDKAVHDADKFLQKKNPKFDSYSIRFLQGIAKKDLTMINENLELLFKGYRNAKWLHEFKDPFLKLIANFPIGLYKLASHLIQNEAEQIELPDHPTNWLEFAKLDVKAKPVVTFENELSGLNQFL